jgi:gliding motility-associated-like protein
LVQNNKNVSICNNTNAFTFYDSSTIIGSGSLSSRWFVSDGSYSTANPLVKSFTSPGKFWVRLVSRSVNGCESSDSTQIEIYPEPTAKFYMKDTAQCLVGNNFEFYDSTSINVNGGTLNYLWNFGDGTTSTLDNPIKTYKAAGVYTVSLRVTSSYGCSDTQVSFVRVYDMPKANFTVNNWNQCLATNKFDFVNLSTIATGNGSLTYYWDFGIPGTSTQMSPSVKFTGSGMQPVALRATSSFGCSDDSLNYVYVLQNPDTGIIQMVNAIPCHGMSGKLSIQGTGGASPYEYSWNGNSYSSRNTFDTAVAGYYKVVIKDKNGCTSYGEYNFAEPLPLWDSIVKGADAKCYRSSDGMADVYQTTGGTSPYFYRWYKGAKTYFGKTLTNVQAGKYYLVLTENNGCLKNDSVTIFEPSKLVPTVFVTKQIKCFDSLATVVATAKGGSATLSKVDKYDFYWDYKAVASSSVKTDLRAGTHNVMVVDSNGCKEVAFFNLSEPTKMLVTIDSSKDVRCYGNSNGQIFSTVTGGTPGYKYSWIDSIGNIVSDKRVLSGVAKGKYKLAIKDSRGCPDTLAEDAEIFTPMPLNIITIDNQIIDCYGAKTGKIAVSAKGGNGEYKYQWFTKPANVLDSVIYDVKAGGYYVRVTDKFGCIKDSLMFATERAKNKIALISDSISLCEFDSLKLNAGLKDSIAFQWKYRNVTGVWDSFGWNDNGYLAFDSFPRNRAGYYQINAVDRYGCEDSARIHVRVNLNPIVTITSDPKIGCIGSTAILTGLGADTYKWFKPRTLPTFGYDTLGYNFVLQLSNIQKKDTGTYYVLGTTKEGCSGVGSYVLNVGLDSIQVMPDTSVCEGGVLILRAKGGVQYQWTGPNGNVVNSPSYIINPADLTDNGIYTVKISDKWTCTGNYTTRVKIQPKPKVALTDVKAGNYCEGESLQLIANTDANLIDWSGPNGLNLKQTTQIIVNVGQLDRVKQGTYKVIGYSTYGCIDSSSSLINVRSKPTAAFDFQKRCLFLIQNEAFDIFSNSSGASKYEYLFDNVPIAYKARHTYTIADTGIHSIKLKVTNDYGCTDEIEKMIDVKQPDYLELPNAFTPNNDMINNVFYPVHTSAITHYRMQIYNRWGEKVFDDKDKPWNGKDQYGNYYNEGVYVVILEYASFCSENPNEISNPARFDGKKGPIMKDVTLLR